MWFSLRTPGLTAPALALLAGVATVLASGCATVRFGAGPDPVVSRNAGPTTPPVTPAPVTPAPVTTGTAEPPVSGGPGEGPAGPGSPATVVRTSPAAADAPIATSPGPAGARVDTSASPTGRVDTSAGPVAPAGDTPLRTVPVPGGVRVETPPAPAGGTLAGGAAGTAAVTARVSPPSATFGSPAVALPPGGRVESAGESGAPRPAVSPADRTPRPESPATADTTIQELVEATRLRPDDPQARLALGSALAARGELDPAIREVREALRHLERARATDDSRAQAELHLDTGRAQLAQGDMAGAVRSLRLALGLVPDLVPARVSLGVALHGMGDIDGAIDEFRAALRHAPDTPAARLGLAAALMARQDWAGARAALEHVLRLDPGQLQALATLGIVRYAAGDLHGAIDAYRRVLARDPERHDARYALAVLLKLARRDAEATHEFLAAARGGVPKAQYFAGAAYAAGTGVGRDLPAAIAWWFRAAEQGVAQAEEALAQLRQTARGQSRRAPPGQRQAVDQAFAEFRASLWTAFPDLGLADQEGVGAALLRAGRVDEAVPVLLREALAVSDRAPALLEALYMEGVEGHLPAHDRRILAYLRTVAGEGDVRARLALARIHARGLGVPRDLAAAETLLRATPHEDAERLLHELSAASAPAPARP